ncbi:hypothetical protein SAMN05660226_01270 [Parapedobacter luteus]|uniref:Uncharacterized protein n=1 Tax=Parapedobacter luteus TaxID=623280 RepID=A0A1T5B1R0_9SPHI|nr:hypothetical protein SAMN05660226_01270 [Parapedobacter luteus]
MGVESEIMFTFASQWKSNNRRKKIIVFGHGINVLPEMKFCYM